MAPDLNSLPTSRPPSLSGTPLSHRPRRISVNNADASRPSPPSPRSPSLSSLQAAATINAGLQRPPDTSGRNHPGLGRRRSSLLNNFSINDPAVPAPGEMQFSNNNPSASPGPRRRSFALATAGTHHHRQPSLGELHQELENEQEAQVNRLLQMIRIQQDQLANIQRQQQQHQDSSAAATEQSQVPASPSNRPTATSANSNDHAALPHSAVITSSSHHFNRPTSLSRQSSHRLSHAGSISRGNSPALRPQLGTSGPSTEEFALGSNRDECAYYQAETQTLTRENQMLKLRIRELERQIADMSASPELVHGSTLPTQGLSPLAGQPATFMGDSVSPVQAEAEAYTKVD